MHKVTRNTAVPMGAEAKPWRQMLCPPKIRTGGSGVATTAIAVTVPSSLESTASILFVEKSTVC